MGHKNLNFRLMSVATRCR